MNMKMMQHTIMPGSQQGAVLVVSLMILIVLTLIGLNGMQTTNLQESMAGSTRNYNIALQAAEVALIAGEADANSSSASIYKTWAEGGGYYDYDPENIPDVWDTANTWVDAKTVSYSGVLTDVSSPPRYYVELITEIESAGATSKSGAVTGTTYKKSPTLNVYRITVRATGGNESAAVVLQSTYTAQND